MQRYFKCDCKVAMKCFKIDVHRADELSQFATGLMHFNGKDVAKDPVTVCTCLNVAAEHKFAKYVAVSNGICGTRAPTQRRRFDGIRQAVARIRRQGSPAAHFDHASTGFVLASPVRRPVSTGRHGGYRQGGRIWPHVLRTQQ
jgi:hypothetical protein